MLFFQSPQSVSTTKYNLGAVPYEQFSYDEDTEPAGKISLSVDDNNNFVALQYNANTDTITETMTEGDIIRYANIENEPIPPPLTPAELPERRASTSARQPKILNDDFVTKFYVGSLYVIGLYIFYRILVKNK
jgi:hypothetical protein